MSVKLLTADAKQSVEQLLKKWRDSIPRIQELINVRERDARQYPATASITRESIGDLKQSLNERVPAIKEWENYLDRHKWETTNDEPEVLKAGPVTLKFLFNKKVSGIIVLCCNAFFEVRGLYSEEEAKLLLREKIRKMKREVNYLKSRKENPEADLGYERQSIPEEVRNAVWRRDKGKCVQCGSVRNLEFDHLIPVSKGGSNTARNLQLLCETCNRKKSDIIG